MQPGANCGTPLYLGFSVPPPVLRRASVWFRSLSWSIVQTDLFHCRGDGQQGVLFLALGVFVNVVLA
jgi:hypothetical protein